MQLEKLILVVVATKGRPAGSVANIWAEIIKLVIVAAAEES